jgi:hypothetical protein
MLFIFVPSAAQSIMELEEKFGFLLKIKKPSKEKRNV